MNYTAKTINKDDWREYRDIRLEALKEGADASKRIKVKGERTA